MNLWLKDLPWTQGGAALAHRPAPGLTVWQSADRQFARAYLQADAAPEAGWTLLAPLAALPGASAGATPGWHYVVETDVAPAHEAELNAWYQQEHLPGLAAVPGAVMARRWRRPASAPGAPLYLACYDLTDPLTLDRPEWLAVRHTAWSDRVRPTFLNTRRTMFHRPDGAA